MTGLIPQSEALSEAEPQSLSELLSRDPFQHSQKDRGTIVALLREQRVKWEAAEAAGKTKPAQKASSNAAASLITKLGAGDLGL